MLVMAVFLVMVWLLALKTSSAVALGASVRVGTSATPFGSQVLGTMGAARTVVVTDANPAHSVTIKSVELSGADASDFLLGTTSCDNVTLVGSRACSIAVRFSPSAAGPRSGSLIIHSSGSTRTVTVALSGQGVAPPLTANPSVVNFGPVGLGGTSLSQTVSVSNASSRPLVVQNVDLVGDNEQDFSMTAVAPGCIGITVAPGSTCEVTVAFAPTAVGTRSASLMATYEGSSSPLYVPLSGTGADLSLEVNATDQSFSQHHSFGDQAVGTTSVPVAVNLTAPDGMTVHLGAVSFSGPDAAQFVIESDDCVGVTLARQITCTVWVAFAPTAQGPRVAALSVVRSNEATAVGVVQFDGFAIVPRPHVTRVADPRPTVPRVTARTVPAAGSGSRVTPAGGASTTVTASTVVTTTVPAVPAG